MQIVLTLEIEKGNDTITASEAKVTDETLQEALVDGDLTTWLSTALQKNLKEVIKVDKRYNP